MYGFHGHPPAGYAAARQPCGAPHARYPQLCGPYASPHFRYVEPMTMAALVPRKSAGVAVSLELLGGALLQTFGLGHIYAGNLGVGLGLMFGYWTLAAINLVLCFAFVGFITWPITWLSFVVISSLTADNATRKANDRATGQAY